MALLQSYSPGTIKQYAADDLSVPAQGQRQWWKNLNTTQANAIQQKQAEAPSLEPSLKLLKATKNQGVSDAATGLLGNFNLNKEAGNKGFADYLAQANEQNAQAKQDLATDRSALDTTAFSKTLADLRSKQEANLLAMRDDTIKYAAGDRERMLATSGLPSGASSDMENRAISAYISASRPVTQEILDKRAQDAETIQRLNMSTVGKRGSLSDAYLNRSLAPEQARASLLNSQIGNLSGISNLMQGNDVYEKLVSKPYDPNTPFIPSFPVRGQSYVPPVRNLPPLDYGLLNRTQPPGQQGVGRNVNQAPRSQAEEGYKRDTGFYPQDDPNFNTMLYESYGGRIGQQSASSAAPERYPPATFIPQENRYDDATQERIRSAWSNRNMSEYPQFAEEEAYTNNL